MRNLTLILSLLFGFCQAQVGIGTQEPTKTLDINGNLKINQLPVKIVGTTDKILTIDNEGNLGSKSTLEGAPAEPVAAEHLFFNAKKNFDEFFSPSLDLWTEQELYGYEGIKNVYFLGLKHRITLPQNITKENDGKIRKIKFILIHNNAPNGFDDTTTAPEGILDWRLVFQTKKFELQSNNYVCVDDETYLYQTTISGSKLFASAITSTHYKDEGNIGGRRREFFIQYSNRIATRELVFLDFNGKWILSVRD